MNKKILITATIAFALWIGFVIITAVEDDIFAFPNYNVELKIDTYAPNGWYTFSEQGDRLIRTALLKPAERMEGVHFWDKELASRCGSGSYYNILSIPSTADPYFKGEASVTKACKDLVFFKFRVNPKGNVFEILDKKTQKYVPADLWFKTHQSFQP